MPGAISSVSTDTGRFAARYLAFVADTRGSTAEDALFRHFGARLDDPAVQADAYVLLDSLVGQLEAEVGRIRPGR